VSFFCAGRNAGFTLLEVVVVMGLIAILSAAAVLSLAFYIPNLHLKTTAQQINIQLQKARLEAISRGKPVAVRFFATDLAGVQQFAPIIWVDDNYDATNTTHPLLEAGEEILYRMPVTPVGVNRWQSAEFGSVRFNPDKDANGVDDVDTDGVTFSGNNVVINSRGLSNGSGSVYLVNNRDRTKRVMLTLGGAVRVF
jgi:prepilin-type N-terminal cleavage/methylation domain-containing protein